MRRFRSSTRPASTSKNPSARPFRERDGKWPVVVADAQDREVVANALEMRALAGTHNEALVRLAVGDGIAGGEHARGARTEDRVQRVAVVALGRVDQCGHGRIGGRKHAHRARARWDGDRERDRRRKE